MGSKRRISKHIVPIIQKYIDDNNITKYIEPFVGGANVIDKIKCKEKYGFDSNIYLIELLKWVQKGGELYPEVSKELYDKTRTALKIGDTSQFTPWQIGNIGFLASYNGRFFDGGYGKPVYEKTKNGLRYRDYYKEAKNNLINQIPHLQGITFHTCDYKESLKSFGHSGMVIYCDPPYQNAKQYSNATNFNYMEFWELMRIWSKKNIVIISEQSAPSDFVCVWEQNVSRSIKTLDKKVSTEKLFIHKSKIR